MERKIKILVTRRLPDRALRSLARHFMVEEYRKECPMPRPLLIEKIRDKHGLVCLLTDRIDKTVMAAGRRLRIIANFAAGYDNIDISAATSCRIAVTNTPGVLTETTADLAFALLLSVARRIVTADDYVRKGRFKGWAPTLLLGHEVAGKTIGIIGFGKIGQAVARRAKGFNMKILYFDIRRASAEIERIHAAQYSSLNSLLRRSDFISVHTPLNRRTFHLIAEPQLSLMKKTAYLINTSRGAVVDEAALEKILHRGKISGAALDVYEKEPMVRRGLIGLENVVLVPHIGSATIDTRNKMAMMVVDNMVAMLIKSQRPPNLVNPALFNG